jgi:hypothetical protein
MVVLMTKKTAVVSRRFWPAVNVAGYGSGAKAHPFPRPLNHAAKFCNQLS